MSSLILKTATRLLVGLILTFSIYLLMRGHNAPGGGFAAALVAGNPQVGGFGNCGACHRGAERGSFDEHQVRIPGYPYWDD